MKEDLKELRSQLRRTRHRLNKAKNFLLKLQQKRYHEPNSDWHEYCAGCGHTPYSDPPHRDDCPVPELAVLLKLLDSP